MSGAYDGSGVQVSALEDLVDAGVRTVDGQSDAIAHLGSDSTVDCYSATVQEQQSSEP